METKTYPHLTLEGGAWTIIDLPEWTPSKNLYIPLKLRRTQELDRMILAKINPEWDFVRAYLRSACLTTTTKATFPIRSPYADPTLPDIFYVSLVRALLSIQFGFSYHNWQENLPPGTTLGRTCAGKGCKNPHHYMMGIRRSRAASIIMEAEEEDRPIPKEFEDWTELVKSMSAMILEGKEVGDEDDKILRMVEPWALVQWGDRPLPAMAGYQTIKEFIQHELKPRAARPGELRRPVPQISEAEVIDIIAPLDDRKGKKR